jgi:exopolyphosphatase/guanosine-5'-triphosphate,3'-diphosphate pyrophosphatase
MPTHYWLIDPMLCEAVSKMEAGGGVRRAAREVPAHAVADAHTRYAAERDAHVPPNHEGAVPSGGVGGTRVGVKCLHAHLAWYLAGGDDPVGRWTAHELGLDPATFVRGGGVGGPQRGAGPVAAVDCGTNSTRLLVVGEDGGVLSREMRITRLGEGVDSTGRLSAEAIGRTTSVLRQYRDIMDRLSVTRVRAVATSATRDAVNVEQFMVAATEALAARPEVLTGLEEGRLSFRGATAHLPAMPVESEPTLVVDIGGGSTEVIVGHPRGSDVTAVSLDIGCVRVSERFFLHDPPSPEELTRARGFVEEGVIGAQRALPQTDPHGVVVGLAGTVSTVASLERAVGTYDRDLLHHTPLSCSAVGDWLDTLADESSAERSQRPGVDAGRADVIVGGVLILAVVMDVFGCDVCLYSEDDILDGLAAELLASAP